MSTNIWSVNIIDKYHISNEKLIVQELLCYKKIISFSYNYHIKIVFMNSSFHRAVYMQEKIEHKGKYNVNMFN